MGVAKDIINNVCISSGFVIGLSLNSYACKSVDCTFFMSSIVSISVMLVLFDLAYLMKTKSRITIASAYIGLASALTDIVIIFVYTKILCCNSLFFCLLFVLCQIILSIVTCFMPLNDSVSFIIASLSLVYIILGIEFAEINGFSIDQVPQIVWENLASTNTRLPFIPTLGFRILLTEFSKRTESGKSAGFFSSLFLYAMGAALIVLDVPGFHEELSKIRFVMIPFILSQVILAASITILKLNHDVSLASMCQSICISFMAISLAFCSGFYSTFWKKTIVEEVLTIPYLSILVILTPFIFYLNFSYGSKISSHLCEESLIAKMFSLTGTM